MVNHADRIRRAAYLMLDVLNEAADEIDRLQRHESQRALTQQEVLDLIAEYPTNRMMLARAVERAHGIDLRELE